MYTKTSGTEERIDDRARKAASESMTVVALGSGEFKVYSGTRKSYLVDVIKETCDCPDEEYNHPADGCKHRHRVEMELGQREIPDLGGRLDVEIMSGRSRETEPTVATDGGVAVESTTQDQEPTITRHVEPESQGGATYFRCACGREAMRKRDLTSETHKEECDAR